MKNLLTILFGALLLMSCTTAKRSSAPIASGNPSRQSEAPVFLENISVKPGNKNPTISVYSKSANTSGSEFNKAPVLEASQSWQFKYAILLNVPVEEVIDEKMATFIESWYGTPYRLGGKDKTGVDCSAFVQSFMAAIYGLSLSRTSREQYDDSRRIHKDDIQEGDLVFFYTKKRKEISHVGIYLCNHKFVHASTSLGVIISDMDEEYYSKRFAGAGRVR